MLKNISLSTIHLYLKINTKIFKYIKVYKISINWSLVNKHDYSFKFFAQRKNQSSDNSEENAPKYQLRIPSYVVEIYENILPNSLFEIVPQATDNQQTSENERKQNNKQQ